MNTHRAQEGSVNPLVVSNVLLAALTIGFGATMLWAMANYNDQKNNVDSKVAVAVASAKKDQTAQDEKDFLEREKQPYIQFKGPDDMGGVTFNYPKTWSAYTAQTDANGFAAYLHPGVVPVVQQNQQFALEVKVQNRSFDTVLKGYDSLVKAGKLKSSQVVVNGFSGTRLDGSFTTTLKGSIVLFKVRDKTLSVATDADTFIPDYDNIILKSLDFNP